MYADVVVLGSGIAGRTAAETVRLCQPQANIMMISREESCLRPLLSKAGFNRMGQTALSMEETEWLRRNEIRLLRTEISALEPEAHLVHTAHGCVAYKKCIYALGSEAFVPPIPGAEQEGVFTVRTVADMTAMKRRLPRVRRAVIIGGGVIGIETGEILAGYGVEVTVLESLPWLLPRVLDRETAEEYRARLTGCRVETGIAVRAIEGDGAVSGVSLADGRVFPCELVIISCGVRPNGELARSAGLQVQRGVEVDDRMRTSHPDIYACGDCAQYQGRCAALWKVAMEQGRTAGYQACGRDSRYREAAYPVVFYSPESALFAMGELNADENCRVEQSRWKAEQPYRVMRRSLEGYSRLVYRDGRLIGAALIGDLSRMGQLQRQIAGEEA